MFTPIMRAEWAFQRRERRSVRWLGSPFVYGLLIGGASAAGLMLPHAESWAALMGVPVFDLSAALRGIQSALMLLTIGNLIGDYWRVVGSAARGGSVALTREYQARTWESLILTGVSARQLVIGKWWGVLRAVWDGERRMLIIRAVAFVWLLSPLADMERSAYRTVSAGVIAAALSIALLTPPLMSGLAAALGVAVSAMTRRDAVSVRVGMGALLAASALLLTISALTGAAQQPMVAFSATLPLEGGIFTTLSLGIEIGVFYSEPVAVPVERLLITAAAVLALTAAALYAAVLIALEQGALPHR